MKNNHSKKKVVRIECVLIILSIVSALQTLKDNYEFIIFFNLLFRLFLTCFGNFQKRGCKTAVPRAVPQTKICWWRLHKPGLAQQNQGKWGSRLTRRLRSRSIDHRTYTVKPCYKQPIQQALQIAYIWGLLIVKFLYRLVETRILSL